MNIFAELKKQDIELQPKKDFTEPTTFSCDCPQPACKNSRTPTNKTPLRVEVQATYAEWRCTYCLWSGHIGERPAIVEDTTGSVPVVPTKSPKSLPPEALAYLAAKGMTEEDVTKYKLGWDGTKKAIKIPYFEGNTAVNYALIRISDGKSKLELPNKAVFYGIETLGINSEPVIIAHNELDTIILLQRGFINVIGVPCGGVAQAVKDEFNQTPDKFAFLSHAAQKAKGWHKVIFAFDDTGEGLALRQELARRLGPGRCSVARLSGGSVSASLLLGSDTLCADINEANPLPIFGLFAVSDFERELYAYFESGMASGVSTGWPNVDKLYTVVPGQLTVVTGIPNSGKSEWLDALSVNLALNFGWRFAAFSPENGKEAHTTKLVEKRVEMSADPKSYRRMSFDTLKAGAKWVDTHYTFIESTDTMPTLEWILERAKDAALRYGIKGLIIDPWNRIEKKLGERQNETDYVAESIPKILRFAANYGVHVWLVVHPKQQQKNHKTGKIDAPSLYDMAGSAHFVNMCDNGVVIHRSDSIDDTTEVFLRKVRFKHVGRRGETKLKYDSNSGRFSPLDEEITASQRVGAERYKAASGGDDDAIIVYEA